MSVVLLFRGQEPGDEVNRLLHHRTDEPWATSTRRRVLVELIWGVEDWITEAAARA